MNRVRILFSTIVIVLAFMVAAAYAQVPAAVQAKASDKKEAVGGEHPRMEKKFEELAVKLGLTEEQKKQLDENRAKTREKMSGLMEKTKQLRQEFDQALQKSDVDGVALKKIHEQLKAAQGEMEDQRLDSILEVKKILTPKQFSDFMAGMKMRHPSGDKEGQHGEGRGHMKKGAGPEPEGPMHP